MSIEVTKTEVEDDSGKFFLVRVGPENHVCKCVRRFYWLDEPEAEKYQDGREAALQKAMGFMDGAIAAIEVSSGLVERFLSVPRN